VAAVLRPLALLPEGKPLPEDIWRSRHRGVCALLWLHVLVLPIVGVFRDKSLVHAVLEAGAVGVLAAVASRRGFGRGLRTSSATLGLVMSSAILVHLFDGLIEMHFHFFVMVVVISLYQSWRPFLLALGFVVLNHSIGGAVAAGSVYDHPPAQSWAWALVHGGFILAQSLACLVCWRASENTLDRERQAREDLHKAHQDLTAAQALAGVGSWDWDVPAAVVSWSDQFYAIAGLHRDSFTPTVESFLALVHEGDRDRVAALIDAALEHLSTLDYEARLVRPDGTVRVVHALGECAVDGAGALVKLFGTCQDITERKLLHEKIEHMAFHDPLTGLANRALFLNRLEHALAVQARSARSCAVLFLDLDGFKTINDLATARETRSSWRSDYACRPRCAATTRWRVSAVTSSLYCSKASTSRQPPRSPIASTPRSGSWSRSRAVGSTRTPASASRSAATPPGRTTSCATQTPPCTTRNARARTATASSRPPSYAPEQSHSGGHTDTWS